MIRLTTEIAVDHHHRSLDELQGEGPESLQAALEWLFPIDTPSLGEVQLIAVEIASESYWQARVSEPRWVRPVRITIAAGEVGDSFEVDLPWLCDNRALQTTAGDDWLDIGAHTGLFLGQPLHPRAQLVPRPGLRARRSENETFAVLVPDVGSDIAFGRTPRRIVVQVGQRRREAVSPEAFARVLDGVDPERFESPEHRAVLRSVAALARDGGSLTRRFAPETLRDIDDTLSLHRPTWPQRIRAVVAQLVQPGHGLADPLADELSRESLQMRLYGDVLRRTVAAGLLRGLRRFRRVERDLVATAGASEAKGRPIELISRLTVKLGTGIQSHVDTTLRPGTDRSLVSADDDRGTVASVECRRVVTRYGPGGVGRPGAERLWLRGLHPDRRGEICPLLTPESEDIGFVRSFCVGATAESDGIRPSEPNAAYSDLSVAAGLIPFVNHDDPTRASIAARLLRQAVPISGAQRPRVETPVADLAAGEVGVVKATFSGVVESVGRGWVRVKRYHGGTAVVGFGPAKPSATNVASDWRVLVDVGTRIYEGDVLAHARDVVVANDGAHLAQGRDCLVAYTPWHGWNFEDAIVVSEAVVTHFSSDHLVRFSERFDLNSAEIPRTLARAGDVVMGGSPLVEVLAGDRVLRVVHAADDGSVTRLDIVNDEIVIEMLVHRPLAIGDKLTNRHGAKGVVSVILPVNEMPRLPDGRPVDVLLNPVGIIRRLNLSQLFEAHVTLLRDLDGQEGTVVVGRSVPSRDHLRAELDRVGAPGGRLRLTGPDGEPLGPTRGVVVGWQHMVKLDHLAANKLRTRNFGRRSPLTQQPAKGADWVVGRLVGGAQRLGEMELWALQAAGAHLLVRDAMARSDGARRSLAAAAAHLRAAGIRLSIDELGHFKVAVEGEPSDLDPLPPDVIQAIIEPKVYAASLNPARDPLHDHHHGLDADEIRCACGHTRGTGAVCDRCGNRTTRRPGTDRTSCRFAIELAIPVRHPWLADDDGAVLHSLAMLPPAYRPFEDNRLDIAYRRLIITNERLRAAGRDDTSAERKLSAAVERVLGRVDDRAPLETIASRLHGKRGLLRRSLRGRDTDFAARGVIVPDPTIDPETIGVPTAVTAALDLDANKYEFSDVVLVNRQPTLLPTNLVALRARPVLGSAFRIHPFLCARLAGDFDGDEITVHRPVAAEAAAEAWEHFRPSASYRHPANGRVVAKVDLDVALGLWLTGSERGGRAELANELGLGEDDPLPVGSGPIVPDEQAALVDRCANSGADGTAALKSFVTLFGAGVRRATGWSFSAVELEPVMVPGEGDLERHVAATVPATSALGEALAAGIAGKMKGIVQLVCRRGSLNGFDGNPTPFVAQSFLAGLANEGFFSTAPGGLRALSDKKLVTPLAGGLTKALIEAGYDVTVEAEVCGSDHVGFGAALTCLLPGGGVCARCYRSAGGGPARLGQAVGLSAAFAVGERTTQNAMKAFQGGTRLVGGNVGLLTAVFGRGSVTVERPDGRDSTQSLARHLDACDGPEERLALFDGLRRIADEALDGLVGTQHYEVLWRRLLAVHAGNGDGALLDRAQRTGSTLVDATSRGRLAILLAARPDQAAHDGVSPLRMTLVGHLGTAQDVHK